MRPRMRMRIIVLVYQLTIYCCQTVTVIAVLCISLSCLRQPLSTRKSMFYTQNDPSGLTLFPPLSMRTSNLLHRYSTVPNVRSLPPICPSVVLIKLRYTLLHHNTSTCNVDKDATDYFRAIVKTGEKSPRVLQLTETIIRLNPAHYSAWCAPSVSLNHYSSY